ncbi:uncharacterized protein SCHCODRAFT_02617722 [Schizophyllum commune H4-8]|nr:uncharacterized protein SCHCODRAFT_02617722 [Schizophyllum commune H4-8]KAI5894756.1 hypothetical protein SCHCODRAFT_02617722 [Schizophyllum commune H4-8]
MDDPWGNAWADNNDDRPRSPIVNLKLDVKFDAPAEEGQEADIALPSWSAGPGIEWADPAAYSGTNLWGKLNAADDANGWATESSFADIPLGRTLAPEDLDEKDADGDEEEDEGVARPEAEDGRDVYRSPTPRSPSPPPSPPRVASLPGSPDGVNAFAADVNAFAADAEDAWAPPVDGSVAAALDSPAEAWGAEWAAGDDDAQSVDEWEAAKQAKAKQDHYVPPELLASILAQLEDFSRDYWPSGKNKRVKKEDEGTKHGQESGQDKSTDVTEEREENEHSDKLESPDAKEGNADNDESLSEQAEDEQEEEEEETMEMHRGRPHSRHPAIDELEGMEALVDRLIPKDVSFSGFTPFPKSVTAKRMADTIRLTRHATLARLSPMHHLGSSKGSLAWEASVKARPEYNEDAVVPTGWKILPKEERLEPMSPTERKPAGGLFSSLFSRRSSTPPVSAAASTSGTPRASMDAPRTPTRASPASVKSPTTSTPPIMQATQSAPPAAKPSTPPITSPPQLLPSNSHAPEIFPAPAPAPSAVSRFLSRFSRRSSSSERASLALSTDDLDFLNDVEPVAETKPGHRATSSFNLDMAFHSPAALPPRLEPPPVGPKIAPLPPPPSSSSSSAARPQSMPSVRPTTSATLLNSPPLHPTTTTVRMPTSAVLSPTSALPTSNIPPIMKPMSPTMTGSSMTSMTSSGTASTAPQNDFLDLDFGAFDAAPPPVQKQAPFAPLPKQVPFVPPPQPRSQPPPQVQQSAPAMSRAPSIASRPPSITTRAESPAIGARRGTPVAIMSSTPAPAAAVPKLAPAFSLAPPPSSSAAPLTSSRPGHRPGSSISRQPPPQPVIPPSLLGDDDDDDFSDFSSALPDQGRANDGALSPEGTRQGLIGDMSPALFGDPSPPAQPAAGSGAGAFGKPTMSGFLSGSSLASLPSTASTSSAMMAQAPANDSFDDFDDFVSPTDAKAVDSLWGLTDGDGDHKQTSAIQTPSPPRPPAKNRPPPLGLGLAAPRFVQPAPHTPQEAQTLSVPGGSDVFSPPPPLYSPSVMPPPKKVSGAAHMRTLSLMEAAAHRQGRWPPAPPSPLPEAIPPPPSGHEDLLGEGSGIMGASSSGSEMGGVHATGHLKSSSSEPMTMAKPPSKFVRPPPLIQSGTPLQSKLDAPPTPTVPTLAPPPTLWEAPAALTNTLPSQAPSKSPSVAPVLSPPSGFSFPPAPSTAAPSRSVASPPPPATDPFAGLFGSSPAPAKASGPPSKGGLSAQDLSFFEGL